MYYDLLAKVKNASRAHREGFQTAYSGQDLAVAKLLVRYRFLKDAQKRTIGKKHYIEIKLLYRDSVPAFSDFRFFSKPSRRLYYGYRELMPVRQNYGIGVVSTPQGMMTTGDARKAKVGGEYLFQIW